MRMRELDLKQGRAQNFLDPEKKKSSSANSTSSMRTPVAHTRLQGMLTGAPVLCFRGVILDLTRDD